MLLLGLTPIIIDQKMHGDVVVTDLDAIRDAVIKYGAASIACVLTTTSCFAPRECDSIVEVATICKEFGIGHIINNAYGIQSFNICKMIDEASR